MSNQQFYILLGIAAIAGAYLYTKGSKVAEETADGLNPLNNDNWFYTGANKLADVLMDGQADGDQYLIDLFDWDMWGR